MNLTLNQIEKITTGAERVKENDNLIRFYRFTEEQEEIYKQANEDFYMKTFASSGMKLSFETDSRELFFGVYLTKGSTRTYFSFDIFVNGEPVGYLDNYSDVTLPTDYTTIQLPLGEFSKTFELGEGIKKVCIYLPWSVSVEIRELSLDDNSFIKPSTSSHSMNCEEEFSLKLITIDFSSTKTSFTSQ